MRKIKYYTQAYIRDNIKSYKRETDFLKYVLWSIPKTYNMCKILILINANEK